MMATSVPARTDSVTVSPVSEARASIAGLALLTRLRPHRANSPRRVISGPSRKASPSGTRSRKPCASSVAASREAVLLCTPSSAVKSVTRNCCPSAVKAASICKARSTVCTTLLRGALLVANLALTGPLYTAAAALPRTTSALDLLRQLVPGLASPDLVAQAPAHRLGRCLHGGEQRVDARLHARRIVLSAYDLGRAGPDGLQVVVQGGIPAPVARAQASDIGAAQRRGAILRHGLVLQQERERVDHVLLVQLHDLELEQQQVGGREGRPGQGEARLEVELVAHLKGAQEDVDLPTVLLVVEEQARGAVQGVEMAVGRVALRGQELAHGLRGAPRRGEVNVLIRARELRPLCRLRTAQPHGHPAQQAQRYALFLRQGHHARALRDDVLDPRAHRYPRTICALRTLSPRRATMQPSSTP